MSIGHGPFDARPSFDQRKTLPAMRIGDWTADPNLDELSSATRIVKLEPRAMRLLCYLAANRNRVVGLPEMLDEVWPNVVVTPQSVYSTIAQLRQILGDSTDSPKYIATVPRKGYRLIAEVAECAAPAAPPLAGLAAVGRASAAPAAAPAHDAPPVAAEAPRAGAKSGQQWGWIALAAAAALAALLYMRLHQSAAPASTQTRAMPAVPSAASPVSVAVLPFLDLSEKKDFEYFSDGLTEELIDLLAHNTSLRVPARTSSFYFKGRPAPVAQIAQQLNVANLLEGSVRRSGGTVRVTAQLIRAQDGFHLWSQTYDRDTSDSLALQDDIAGKVAEVLRAKLTPRAAAAAPAALDSQSRNLLLECQYYLQRNTPSDAGKAVDCFHQLVTENPNSARAWIGYSSALGRRPNIAEMPAAQASADTAAADEAARRALQLDPTTAAAHAHLASNLTFKQLDWEGAEREIHIALESDPNDPTTLLSASRLAARLGRTDQAIVYADLARERDPLNFIPYARLGLAYLLQGRYQEAEAVCRKRLDISPDGSGGHIELAFALMQEKRFDDALAELAREKDGRDQLFGKAIIYFASGRRAEADAAYQELSRQPGSMSLAEVAAFRGDNDRAFEVLNAAVSARSLDVYNIKTEFLFNSLRSDPRYAPLMRRMNLPD